jgi:hypothetical protein
LGRGESGGGVERPRGASPGPSLFQAVFFSFSFFLSFFLSFFQFLILLDFMFNPFRSWDAAILKPKFH